MASNGALTSSDLSSLPTNRGEQLEKNAAASWGRLHAAMKSKYGWAMGLTDSYRSLADQRTVFLSRYKPQASGSGPFGDVRKYNGVRYVRVSGAPAAIPGNSNHGNGRAVDISGVGGFNTTKYRQLNELAAHHGWSNTEGRSIGEYWHWVYTYANDKARNGSSTPSAPKVTVAQIKELQRAVNTPDDGYWGPKTYNSIVALREASRWAGRKFPWGTKVTQRVVGRPTTGKWSGTDDKAHTETVKKVQKVFKIKADGLWGPNTEAKFQAFRRVAKGMNK